MKLSKKTEKSLQSSEISCRSLFKFAPDGIFILDAETGKIIDVNQSAIALVGGAREEILDKKLTETGFFKNKNKVASALEKLKATGFIQYQDLQIETKSGERREAELTGSTYSEETRVVFQLHLRDITERKLAEKEREQKAQEAAQLAQIASRVARLGGWTIELPERTLTWSDENCAIHEVPPGYKPSLEEGIGYFPEEYREQVIQCVENCIKDGTPYDFELPKYTAKGRLIWVRSTGEAVRNADGEIIRLQGAFQDITAQKQAEAEREKLIKELQNALAEVRTLRAFLPICSYCRKIRDDENYWLQIEKYISKHTDTRFSHGICPECYENEVIPRLEKLKQDKSKES